MSDSNISDIEIPSNTSSDIEPLLIPEIEELPSESVLKGGLGNATNLNQQQESESQQSQPQTGNEQSNYSLNEGKTSRDEESQRKYDESRPDLEKDSPAKDESQPAKIDSQTVKDECRQEKNDSNSEDPRNSDEESTLEQTDEQPGTSSSRSPFRKMSLKPLGKFFKSMAVDREVHGDEDEEKPKTSRNPLTSPVKLIASGIRKFSVVTFGQKVDVDVLASEIFAADHIVKKLKTKNADVVEGLDVQGEIDPSEGSNLNHLQTIGQKQAQMSEKLFKICHAYVALNMNYYNGTIAKYSKKTIEAVLDKSMEMIAEYLSGHEGKVTSEMKNDVFLHLTEIQDYLLQAQQHKLLQLQREMMEKRMIEEGESMMEGLSNYPEPLSMVVKYMSNIEQLLNKK